MMEETSPAETVQDAAPATEVAEPAAEPAPEPAPEPAAEPEPVAEPAPAAEPEPEPDVFSLDEWDGNHESLPEEYRHLGEAFGKFYTSKFQPDLDELASLRERASEFETVNEIYKALMNGEEDPRVDALTTKIAEERIAREDAIAKLEELQKQYDEYQAQVEEAEKAYVNRMWDQFAAAHPEIAKQEDLVTELLQEGWDLDSIPPLAALNKKANEAARALVKDEGLRPNLAIELASNRHPDTKPTSRAKVVAGATGHTGNSAALEPKGPLAPKYPDKRELVIARAFNQR